VGLQENTSRHLLIIGGTSSLSPQILEHAVSAGYKVTATSRRPIDAGLDKIRWINFDLEAENEPENFLEGIKGETFTTIVFLIGETSLSYKNKSRYIELHLSKTVKILEALQRCLDPLNCSSLIYLSSRAAIHPSFDFYYSAVKGGVVSAIRSLSLRSLPNHYILSLVPGLIIDSKMFNEMSKESRINHMKRANKKLLTKEEFAESLFDVVNNLEKTQNGQYVIVGQDYE